MPAAIAIGVWWDAAVLTLLRAIMDGDEPAPVVFTDDVIKGIWETFVADPILFSFEQMPKPVRGVLIVVSYLVIAAILVDTIGAVISLLFSLVVIGAAVATIFYVLKPRQLRHNLAGVV